jgi:hypothetical protein
MHEGVTPLQGCHESVLEGMNQTSTNLVWATKDKICLSFQP